MARIKTAISIPEPLFREADSMAKKMNVSRSQFFAEAVEKLVTQLRNRELLKQLNDAYADPLDKEEEKWLAFAKEQHCKLVEKEKW